MILRPPVSKGECERAARKPPERPGVLGSTILTRSGRYFDLMAPTPEMVWPFDIAVALSKTCRFGGHVGAFYSVAQHSVLVSRLVPPALALTGLLHDAAEAYVGDVVAPLKQHLPGFKKIEISIEKVIAARFGIAFPWPPEIKHADLRALRFEREQLMHRNGDWKLGDFDPIDGPLVPLGPDDAAKEWCIRLLELEAAR